MLLSGKIARGTALVGGEIAAVGTGIMGCRSELDRNRPIPRLLRGKLASWTLELVSNRAGLLLLHAPPLVLPRFERLDPIDGWLALKFAVVG